jgi:putative ABC transport system permease protein
MTPMDAIRSGHTGERFSKKSLLKLHGTRKNANMFMAINDILCDFKKYIILFITSIIGIWLIAMPANTINTLTSENIVPWFGMIKSDYYIINHEPERMNEIIGAGDKNMYIEYLQEIKDDLSNNGVDIERVFAEAVFRMKIRFEDTSYQSIALQGINTKTDEYAYLEGTAPVKDNEVAITHVIADIIGAKIGDTVYITVADEEVPFVVTALYQSMNNLGEGIRFTENCELDYDRLSGTLGIQVDLIDSSAENVEKAIEKSREVYKDSQIDGAVAFLDSMLGGTASMIGDVKLVVLMVVIVINVLVVVLMQKIFITKEKGQIAMLKAIGFSKRAIYSWQLRRIGLVLASGMIIGVLTSELFTSLTSGLVFKFMGCKTIEFSIDVLEVYITDPLLVIGITLLGCCLSISKIKKINVQEVNDME